ncbi:nodulation-signaling pathway 2 protein-like [Phalaenopsis equestris]|uniref:nodulation-signaling pathway 2 protein-like n=1 Tax=Phalaenopsis equestris TaxID=78828 RepID=UPI0009E1A0C0|nr:nodulation-signaling pathway 2 protein-like [Phalaenopsis equestris]
MENFPPLIFPAGSSATTNTTTTADDDISLQEWPSPQLNWSPETLHPYFAAAPHMSSTNSSPAENPSSPITPPIDSDKDRRFIHLLTAAAEALSGHVDGRDLARVILVRLKELISTDNTASSFERLSAHFTDALTALLDGFNASPNRGEPNQLPRHLYPATEVLTAFQLLQDMSPLASFGHLTANQAILEAVSGERRVHIIDYDIAEGIQWASLIQAMASRYDGAPTPHLKITAVTNGRRRSASEAKEAGRRLTNFAASVGQPFSFRLCRGRLDQQKRFQPVAVKVVKGEPLVVNCVLHSGQNGYSHGSVASVGSFLLSAAELGARLVTVIEEEVGGESVGEEKGSFLRRFVVELQRYKAIWESLEDGFPKQGRVREMVERVILGPRIFAAVRRAYGRNESGVPSGEWMAAVGFKRVDLSFFNHCQARLLLGFFNEGYRVEDDASNKIVLSWKSRRLLSASVWIPTLRSPSPAF